MIRLTAVNWNKALFSKATRTTSSTRMYLSTSTSSRRNLHGTSVANNASLADNYMDMEAEESNCFMLILGKPGGGKGTISKKILTDFSTFTHFSTGDMLRQHVREKTEIGLEAKKHMDEGSLVPDKLIISLVLAEAEKESESGNSLLLDGFPRTMEQAKALGERIDVDLVVDLNVPNDTIIERIADRWIHPASGRVYNYSYNPPKVHGKDNETGEDLVQRDDDKPNTVRRRLEAYEDVTAPLVKYYEGQGVLKTFSGTESDVIYPEVYSWLDDNLQQ